MKMINLESNGGTLARILSLGVGENLTLTYLERGIKNEIILFCKKNEEKKAHKSPIIANLSSVNGNVTPQNSKELMKWKLTRT